MLPGNAEQSSTSPEKAATPSEIMASWLISGRCNFDGLLRREMTLPATRKPKTVKPKAVQCSVAPKIKVTATNKESDKQGIIDEL